MRLVDDVTELVGQTPLVRLDSLAPNLVGKVESANPYSVKDRIALAMIERAEAEGVAGPETTVVEPTSGNTGIGLAAVCAARGYDLTLTMPESMSEERRALLSALGADLALTPAEDGMDGAIEAADRIAAESDDAFVPGQFDNDANPRAHRETTGPELDEATDGEVDALVAGIGTGGTITGVAEYFKEERGRDDFEAIGVEPASSAVLSGDDPGSHGIQGIGAGFVPDVLRTELVDDVVAVDEERAAETARELGAREGIVAGISSGAALAAAADLANSPEYEDRLVAVVLPDSGERYLSTDLYEADARRAPAATPSDD